MLPSISCLVTLVYVLYLALYINTYIFFYYFQEAVQCLDEHTHKIKLENRELRHELLLLIRKTRALHEHKKHLDEQGYQLLMEQQYARDLKTLRTARQHKVFKSFGILEEEEVDEEMERRSKQRTSEVIASDVRKAVEGVIKK